MDLKAILALAGFSGGEQSSASTALGKEAAGATEDGDGATNGRDTEAEDAKDSEEDSATNHYQEATGSDPRAMQHTLYGWVLPVLFYCCQYLCHSAIHRATVA